MVVPRSAVVFAVTYVGYSVWEDRRASDNVNHGAPSAGAVWSMLFMLVLEPRLLPRFFERLVCHHGWGVVE